MTEQPTVIIVDDDPEIRAALGSLIRSVGVQVKALASVPASTYVTWYHQFAALPTAAIVIDLARHAAMSLPPEVWNDLLSKLGEAVVRAIFRDHRQTDPPPGGEPLVLRVRSADISVSLKVPPDADPETVREVFRGVGKQSVRSEATPLRRQFEPAISEDFVCSSRINHQAH